MKLIEIKPEEVVEAEPPKPEEYERLLTNVLEINNIEKITTIKEKYESYISTLKITISQFQREWDTLYESYQNLLGDIKDLIVNNEKLKTLVLELEGKIESHNKEVNANDLSIRTQIELLTKHSLSKKTIDWYSQKDVLLKAANDIEALNIKVKSMETKEFNSSLLLSSVSSEIDTVLRETSTTKLTGTIITREIIDNGTISGESYKSSFNSKSVITHSNSNIAFTTTTNSVTKGETNVSIVTKNLTG